MKYRNDFVTNSSSSSFIVVFNNVAEMRDSINYLREECPEYSGIIFNDIQREKVTRKEVLEELKQAFESEAYWRYYWNNNKYWGMGSSQNGMKVDPYKDKEIQALVKAYVKEKMTVVEQSLVKRGYYAIVSYSDDSEFYSELEHRIMPRLKFVFKTINNH